MKEYLSKADAIVLIGLLILAGLFAAGFVDFSLHPSEDAAILMRYADHLSRGYGIVWNIGEKPVDGATDFFFMVTLALCVKAGLSLEFAARFIGLTSHVLTIWIVYLTMRRLFHAHMVPSLITSLYLLVGSGLFFVETFFGTPYFALFAGLAWSFALWIIREGEDWFRSCMFAASALLMSLTRPEGVILSALMLIAIVLVAGWKRSRLSIIAFTGFFIVLGGSYFAWRWQYFGFPLPNPFYTKGGWHLHLDGLMNSYLGTLKFCLPLVPIFVLGLYSKATVRLTVAVGVVIIGFASSFVLLSSEMNLGSRFQYVLLPVALMSWWPLLEGVREDVVFPRWSALTRHKKVVLACFITTVVIAIIGYQFRVGRIKHFQDGRYDVATILSDYQDNQYRMATTEAGLLPLYSQWKALDTWGLNDQQIAHQGGLTMERLHRFDPHMIIFHEYFSPLAPSERRANEWLDMVKTMKQYAEENKYVLVASFGETPYDTHYYYIAPDCPEIGEITERIRATDYTWYATGKRAVNYAMFTPR